MSKKQIGLLGQKAVVYFLQKRNIRVLQENVFVRNGELDIIAKEGDELVFIEVKTRLAPTRFFPEDNITIRKRQALGRSISYYLAQNNDVLYTSIRFDVAAVIYDKKAKKMHVRYFYDVLLG